MGSELVSKFSRKGCAEVPVRGAPAFRGAVYLQGRCSAGAQSSHRRLGEPPPPAGLGWEFLSALELLSRFFQEQCRTSAPSCRPGSGLGA